MEPEESEKTVILDGRKFNKKEVAGRWMTAEEVISELEKDRFFYEESKGGVTFSGGEPLMQPEFLAEVLDRAAEKGIDTVLDTSGYADKTVFKTLMHKPDQFLWDIKLMNNEDHMKYTGVPNRQILENFLLLCETGKNVILRLPVIPGITDTRKNIDEIKELLMKVQEHVHEIDLLPWHSLAKSKYKRFCKPDAMGNMEALKNSDLIRMKEEFEGCGVQVKIGG
jgi:pyruvate formate lyase activating enzyme